MKDAKEKSTQPGGKFTFSVEEPVISKGASSKWKILTKEEKEKVRNFARLLQLHIEGRSNFKKKPFLVSYDDVPKIVWHLMVMICSGIALGDSFELKIQTADGRIEYSFHLNG
jgi:hypothetical protein